MIGPVHINTIWMFLAGLVGGFVAMAIGAPLPFMLGGILGAGGFVLWYEHGSERRINKMHPMVRFSAVAVVGTMIGATFSPELVNQLSSYWISGLAVLLFMPMAHAGSYQIMRRVGKYSPRDAYFGAMPGGLIEAVLMGEKMGADVRVLTVQHFVRIIVVVMSVPFLFLIITGEVVGSASGMVLSKHAYDFWDIIAIFAIAAVGMQVGRLLHIPAGHMMGPLLICMALQTTGVTEINDPPWLLKAGQYILGVGLGAQFSGLRRAMLVKGMGMGLLTVAYMLSLSFGFAYLLRPLVHADLSALFISFAPGGVTEMSLIALSLQLSPVAVALHHLIRIVAAVWIGGRFATYMFGPPERP